MLQSCTRTNISWSNKIQRNYKGLKITACIGANYGQQDTKRPKNPTATSKKPEAKAGSCRCSLHTTSPRGWARHLSLFLAQPLDPLLLLPRIRNELTPTWGGSKRACCLFSHHSAKAGALGKPSLNFFGLINFY